MRDFIVIAAIADLHIGNKSISHKEYKYQIKKGIIEKLSKMTFLDMIVLCGDMLHCQISMNSDYAEVFFWFINKIVKIAKDKNAKVRVIKGTRSHDLDQLDTIKFYEQYEDIDFKVIDDYLIEKIGDMNYAFISQNYIQEPIKKYYREIFSKADHYDIIFGHMTIEQTRFSEQNSENIDTHSPIFSLKDLFKCANLIISGHIHTPMVFNDRFYYVGSTLRTAHGEPDDKGWDLITYIPKEKLFRVDKIVNEYTFNFQTLTLDNMYIEQNSIDDITNYINNYIDENKIDKLSVKIACIDSKENNVKIELLKKYLSKNQNITAKFKIFSQKTYEREILNEEKRKTEPYLEPGLSLVERIKIWADIKRGIRLSDEEILKYITPKQLNRERE